MTKMEDVHIAKGAALEGGKVALRHYGKGLDIIRKGTGVDFYTAVDVEAEEAARRFLGEHSPYPIFGEEAGGDRHAEKLWIVDAIDGSPNFRSGRPLWGSAICLLDGGTASHSAILLPALNEMYFAERGRGTFLGNQKLSVTEETDPAKIGVAADVGYEGRGWKFQKLARIAPGVQYLDVPGSASYGTTCVAAGKIGGYIIFDVDMNDTAPGALLVKEAGGLVVNEHGEPFDRNSRTLIAAANEAIRDYILERIGE